MNIPTAWNPGKLLIIATAGLALATASAANGQAADTSSWKCQFCPFENGYRADYQLGASNVSDDSAYFDDATGQGDEGVYANVDGEGSYSGDKYQMRWVAEDLGLDSRFAAISGSRQGNLDYSLSYRELPRSEFLTTSTIFSQSADNTLTLPAGWVRAASTAGLTALDANLLRRDIQSERKILQIGGRYSLPSNRLRFSADYRRQEREGVDISGASYFFQSSVLARPIDYETDEVDLDLRYLGKNGHLSLAWYLSNFQNNDDELRWENPFLSAPGAEIGASAQAPGNRFKQLSLSGGYNFYRNHTVVTFSAALGNMEQQQPFLRYTTNRNVSVSPLPRTNLGGDVDTTNLAITVTSRVFDKARVKLAYRYDDHDNNTGQDIWTGVVAETFAAGTETNTPYSFERSALNLSAEYDLLKTVRISGGYDRKTIDRNFQEVAEQTEDSGWGRLRWHPARTVSVEFKGGAAKRDIDGSYDETVAASLGQNPLLRKYNLAYRYRTFVELTIAAALPESPVSVTINSLLADDSYTRSRMGLTSGDELRLTTDLSWALSKKASLYLTAGVENIDSKQFGSEQFGREDWSATNNDDFITAGGGFRVRNIADKFDLQLDYTRSEGTTEINVTSATDGPSKFPDLESTLEYLRLKLAYHGSERFEVNLNLRYQSIETKDWGLAGVGPATIPAVLTLGAQPYDDEVLVFGIGFRYSIGNSKK